MSNGWIIVCFFTMFVAISMAQITSAIPTSGGPYYWAAVRAANRDVDGNCWRRPSLQGKDR